MIIKILGSRGEISESLPDYSKHSGVLLDNIFLFDLGEKEFLKQAPQEIFITHLHPDHAYFVRRGKEEVPPTKVPIWAPESPQVKAIESTVQILDQAVQRGSYSIIPIPTHHSKLVKSQAYLIKKGKKSILYTGDLVWIDKQYHPLFENVSLVITEASFMRKGGMIRRDKESGEIYGHNGIPNLIDLFKKYTKTILFIHFGSWFYKDPEAAHTSIIALGQEKNIKTLIGFDGMEIRI